MQRKEAALRYRVQLAVFTQTVAGEVAEAWAVEWLRGMVVTTGVMLSKKEGDVGRMVQKVGGKLCAPHMDGNRIRWYF